MASRVLLTLVCLLGFASIAAAEEYYFPIVAAGFTPGSTDQFYATEFVIHNPGSRPVNASLLVFSTSGEPMDVTLKVTSATAVTSTQTNSIFDVNLAANG